MILTIAMKTRIQIERGFGTVLADGFTEAHVIFDSVIPALDDLDVGKGA